MTARLLTPLKLGPIEVPNRIAIAPMCQYTADDGSATDWHLQHWMSLAMSGAGLVVVEATAVERRGRITHGCLGLYSDANERSIAPRLAAAKAVALPGTRFGVQIAHAGRKASSQRPWEGGRALGAAEDPWTTVSASAIPFAEGWHTPHALGENEVPGIVEAFVRAAERAVRVGFDLIEVHMTHGYLMHQFLSPLSNRREDRWGGSAEKRMALPRAVAQAVIQAAGPGVAVGARITGSDWVEGGLTVEDAVKVAAMLKDLGFAYVCVSSGGLSLKQQIPTGPGYQVPLAAEVKRRTGIVTRAVGLIVTPEQAEEIIERGEADQIALARAVLDDPRWGWHAAQKLGAPMARPPQYDRARPELWPGAALAR